jgi:hypothetical protein
MSFAGPHGIKPTVAASVQKHSLLQMAWTSEGVFVYGQASGAITQYDAVKVDNDGQLSQITTAISGSEPTAVGFVQASGLSDNYYAWAFRGLGGGSGKGIKANVLASCAADVKIYTTTTAGALDDTSTDCVNGVCLVTANGGSTAAVEVWAADLMTTNCET